MGNRIESAMEVSKEEFNRIVSNGHKLVVVDFFADWCMPCLMMAPVIEELAKNMKDIKFVKIDVDENSELSEKYEIRSIPTLIFFKNGKMIDRVVGGMDDYALEKKIESLLD
ncbi:MAG: thioredoxin [Nanoarchaeota archaeon]